MSPLLANIYLHYSFDLWAAAWRRRAKGQVIIVRFADDFIVGFEHRWEAERFLEELRERLRKFHLELHPDKTRLIEFGRHAVERRKRAGQGKPETFDFLGFTHMCSTDRKGGFIVRRHTMRQRLAAKLGEVKAELWRRMHDDVVETGRWLASVLRGHYQYYGVPRNIRAVAKFRYEVFRFWRRCLRPRSQKAVVTKERIGRLARRWLPRPRITHPYPEQRLCVRT